MRTKFPFILTLAVVCCVAATGQSVIITPKKQVYRRPKPIQDFKKTFTVRRPVAKASSPTLSKKITSAIGPESVLALNIKEELGEYQWLEEADYVVVYNRNGVLSVKQWMTGTAAYPDSVTKYVVVNLANGNKVRPADVFSNLNGLAAIVKKIQTAEIGKATAEMKKDPENKDVEPEQLFSETDFKASDLREFSVNDTGVAFYYDYGFPHALEALQPNGEYKLPWVRLKPFIRPDGLLARFIR